MPKRLLIVSRSVKCQTPLSQGKYTRFKGSQKLYVLLIYFLLIKKVFLPYLFIKKKYITFCPKYQHFPSITFHFFSFITNCNMNYIVHNNHYYNHQIIKRFYCILSYYLTRTRVSRVILGFSLGFFKVFPNIFNN